MYIRLVPKRLKERIDSMITDLFVYREYPLDTVKELLFKFVDHKSEWLSNRYDGVKPENVKHYIKGRILEIGGLRGGK